MGLFSSLVSSMSALRVFEDALSVTQNNVSNASTPGYAKQRLAFEAMPFQPAAGLPGGVWAAGLESARDEYAERAVQQQQEDLGKSEQLAAELARLEGFFDATGEAGIPGALNKLYQAFSAWSVAPNDAVARQVVIERAGDVAARFVETASNLGSASWALDRQIRNTVDTVNHLAGVLRDLNVQIRQDARMSSDAAVDAKIHTTLEELAQYVDFTVVKQADGSLTVLLGGQTPLVIADRQFQIQGDFSSSQTALQDVNGNDITSQVQRGRLSGMLEMRNSVIPSFMSDLNRLAAGVADRVNAILAAGVDANNQPGAALFTYDPAVGAASTLAVTSISPSQLAAALPDAPGGNGNTLTLMGLADSAEIDGSSFMEFYGTVARRLGRTLESAREDQKTNEQLLLQAQFLRSQASAVSLDEEATRLIQFQRSYQALARMVTALNELTQETINLVQ